MEMNRLLPCLLKVHPPINTYMRTHSGTDSDGLGSRFETATTGCTFNGDDQVSTA